MFFATGSRRTGWTRRARGAGRNVAERSAGNRMVGLVVALGVYLAAAAIAVATS